MRKMTTLLAYSNFEKGSSAGALVRSVYHLIDGTFRLNKWRYIL